MKTPTYPWIGWRLLLNDKNYLIEFHHSTHSIGKMLLTKFTQLAAALYSSTAVSGT